MWQTTYEKTFSGLSRETIWSIWADVDSWPQWDADIEYAKMTDPFQEGATFILKPRGGPKVEVRILKSEPLKGFTDVTRFPLAKMYDIHGIEETQHGLKLTSTIRIEGPLSWLWKKMVAQKVAAGVPTQLEALVRFATSKH